VPHLYVKESNGCPAGISRPFASSRAICCSLLFVTISPPPLLFYYFSLSLTIFPPSLSDRFPFLTLTITQFARADYQITNGSTTETAWVIYSTWKSANGNWPSGFRTQGWYEVEPGSTRNLPVPENNEWLYIRVERPHGTEIKPLDHATRDNYLFWMHPSNAFTVVESPDGRFLKSNFNIWSLELAALYKYRNGETHTITDELHQNLPDLLVPVNPAAASALGVPTLETLGLPSVMVPSKGFAVLAHQGANFQETGVIVGIHSIPGLGLPDLEVLVKGNGGTLELIDNAAVAGAAPFGPLITEIMWGSDLSQTDPKLSQWIEIYNASASEINLSNYALKVTPFSTDAFSADASAVDTVGNLGDGKWEVPGQGGRSAALVATATQAGAAVVPLISMRRKLDFNKVAVNTAGDGLVDVNDGTLSGSWEASTPPSLNLGPNRIGSPGVTHVSQITQVDRTTIPAQQIYDQAIHSVVWIGTLPENDFGK